ncbi:MAG: M16 family metallopeptidase [bacterium]
MTHHDASCAEPDTREVRSRTARNAKSGCTARADAAARVTGFAALVLLALIAPPPAHADDDERVRKLQPFERREETLPNGARLVIVQGAPGSRGAIVAAFDAGESYVNARQKGIATLAARLLGAGSSARSGAALESALAQLSAVIDTRATPDIIEVAMMAPPDSLAAAADLLAEILGDPAYPESLFVLAKEEMLRDARARRTLGERVRDRLARVLYDRHPYSEAPTPASVESITHADLRAFHGRLIGGETATIVIAGDIADDEALVQSARRAFLRLGPASIIASHRPAPPPQTRRRVFLIHEPGARNAAFATGNLGIRISDPDLLSALVVERILGTPGSGRIPAAIRRGGIEVGDESVAFEWRRDPGVFIVSASFDAAWADSGAAIILHELDVIRHDPIAPEEAENAIVAHIDSHGEYVLGALGLARETMTLVQNNLPARWTAQFGDKLQQVSTLDVSRAARRMIRPYSAPLVFAGDGAQLAPAIARFGTVIWLDENGLPLPPDRRPSLTTEVPPAAEPVASEKPNDAVAPADSSESVADTTASTTINVELLGETYDEPVSSQAEGAPPTEHHEAVPPEDSAATHASEAPPDSASAEPPQAFPDSLRESDELASPPDSSAHSWADSLHGEEPKDESDRTP